MTENISKTVDAVKEMQDEVSRKLDIYNFVFNKILIPIAVISLIGTVFGVIFDPKLTLNIASTAFSLIILLGVIVALYGERLQDKFDACVQTLSLLDFERSTKAALDLIQEKANMKDQNNESL